MKKYIAFLFFTGTFSLCADTVLLKDGRYEKGIIAKETRDSITLSKSDQSKKIIQRVDIEEINYADAAVPQVLRETVPAAQKTTLLQFPKTTLKNFSGYGQLGWQQMSLSDTNAALSSAGYPSIAGNYFSAGGGGHVSVNNLVIGGDGDLVWNSGKEAIINNNTIKTSISAVRLSGIIGYLLYTTAHLDVFPYLGVGLADISITLTNTQTAAFDSVLATPQRSSILSSSSLFLTAGVQLEWRLPLTTFQNSTSGLLLGAKAGYSLGFDRSNWASGGVNNTVAVSDGPSALLTGPFGQVIIGSWLNFHP